MRRRWGIVGAGSFGTALAIELARSGHPVGLWARRPELARELARSRVNTEYLPGVELPAGVEPTSELAELASCRAFLVAVPSHGFRPVLRSLFEVLPEEGAVAVVSATKGIETESLARMSRVSAEEGEASGREVRFAVLSGPSFAVELARGAATAAVVASEAEGLAEELREELSSSTFRLYSSDDVAGVEIAGTAKNVVAVAAGVVSGLALGHNTLAALVTRGLHEITRLGLAYGGDARTFAGLAGLGDLMLTCTGGLSRNRSIGVELAKGRSLEEIQGRSSMVAEGVRNSLAVSRMAERREVDMPIVSQMVEILHGGKSPKAALAELMGRDLKAEAEL